MMSSSLSLSLSPSPPSPSLLSVLDFFLVFRVFSKTCELECFTGNENIYRSKLEGLRMYTQAIIHTDQHTPWERNEEVLRWTDTPRVQAIEFPAHRTREQGRPSSPHYDQL